jgi:capsular exopolysaccharide synthesis family protein
VRPAHGIRKWIGAATGEGRPAGLLQGENGKGKGRRNRLVDLTLLSRDNSVMAEAYRAALTAILLANERRGVRTMVVASASPREGKTSSISNLAVGLAELRKKVLLIDGDIRNPQLHDVFGVSNEFGLSELLEQPEQQTTRGPVASGVDGLYLLPVGNASGQTKNLLHSANLVKLLSGFEEEFDIVLIDTAPALHMRDARLLGSLADAVILIVRAGKTSRDAAAAVAEKFRQDGTHVLGVILNDWKPVAGDTVYGHSYLNGYRQYYGRS